jgi:nucleoid DNA-binding protein
VNGGEYVEIDHFRRFINLARRTRVGRNPATGETINVAASSSFGFWPSNDK